MRENEPGVRFDIGAPAKELQISIDSREYSLLVLYYIIKHTDLGT